jgi:hypothetical protein
VIRSRAPDENLGRLGLGELVRIVEGGKIVKGLFA